MLKLIFKSISRLQSFKKKTIGVFFLGLNLLFLINTFGNNSIVFNHLSVKDGLSQSTIYCMIQDTEGFVWIGTRDGLNKYDGYNFQVYRNLKTDSTSISDNRVYEIIEARNGDLWIATENGLNVYNKRTDSFKQYLAIDGDTNALNNNHIYALIQDSQGTIWIGTDGGGVCIYDSINQAFKKIELANSDKGASLRVRSILETSKNQIWIGTKGDGIFSYDRFTSISSQITCESNNCGLLSNSVRLLYKDTDQNIWIGTDEEGLTLYNLNTKKISKFRQEANRSSISHNAIRAIYQDDEGVVWVGTRVGLNKFNSKTQTFSPYFHDELNAGTLSNNSIRSIMQDKSGNLWFGTFYGGINIIYGSSQNFRTFSPNVYRKNSLSYEIVSSFAEDKLQNIWVGTEGGGINMLKPGSSEFKVLLSEDKKNTLSNDNVKALFIDSNNILWIGTYGGGLDVYTIETGIFKNYSHRPNDSLSISSNNIYSIYHDKKNRIWVGTNLGGLNSFNANYQSFKRINPVDDYGSYIFGHTINGIAEDSIGNLWFATNSGLVSYNDTLFKAINLIADENGSSTEINVLAVFVDSYQSIWVGAEGYGLFCYNPFNKKVIQYTQTNGIASNIIYGILEDELKNLWISTNKGLLKFPLLITNSNNSENSNVIITYDINDGLQGNEFNRGAAFKASNGQLFFGGLKGFTMFNPKLISQNKTIPPVLITGFYLSNKKIESYGGSSPLKQHISKTSNITLTHKQSSFSFDFVALNFDKPQKNQYAYMLEGFDTDWIYSGKNHSAVYTNIDPGTYVFKVKASNNDNIWNNRGAQVTLTIKPPFWKTNWAFFMYFLWVTLLMLLYQRIIVYRTNQKNLLENERIENKRIEELNQIKLRFFTNISHEFRTPLTLISGPIERLRYDDDLPPLERKYLYNLMHKNVSRLQRLINQLMDFRKFENKKMKLRVASGNLYEFVKEVGQVFEEFCSQRNIEFTIEANDATNENSWFDRSVVDNVVFILLSNATKFTPDNGKISILVTINDKQAEIKVKDTGIGIPSDKLDKIFERFFSDDGLKHNLNMGTGIGLSFAQNLIELHRGTIGVESQPGLGSLFTIVLPICKEAFDESELKYGQAFTEVDSEKNASQVLSQKLEKKIAGADDLEKEEAILIVEDNLELREFIRSHFSQNYTIYEAENGKEAFKLAKRNMPDIIISDVMMPVMDGVEFCSAIKSNLITNHIPVILLTAKVNIEHKIEGAKSGADIYMEKPFNMELLETHVKNLLVQRNLLRERFAGEISADNRDNLLNKSEDEFIKKATEIISAKKGDADLSVEYLGDALGLSRSQLFRKFKVLTNHSPNEFIKVVRLKYAVELMIAGELNINQIAYECGFSSASHFIAGFKKHYNKTPKEYASLIVSKNKEGENTIR